MLVRLSHSEHAGNTAIGMNCEGDDEHDAKLGDGILTSNAQPGLKLCYRSWHGLSKRQREDNWRTFIKFVTSFVYKAHLEPPEHIIPQVRTLWK